MNSTAKGVVELDFARETESGSEIVVVTDLEEIIVSDRSAVDEYIRNWGPFDIYLRLRSEIRQR
jgi:hypothetical protein